ncbi:MAG: hypothetical protein C0458_05465 [Methylobacterium sp.]|nr:hypothetical protein [Methylobacterium sp.]
MAGDVIKEFLVSLGYRIEANQEKKFAASVGSATNAVVALGAAAAAASAAVSAAVVKISRSFDGLYWQAQRTQTTVSQIKAMSYAVSQLGGSADEAGSSIESFGKHLKWNPGFEGFLKQIGVVTRSNGQLRDSVALMKDFASVLKGKSRAEQMGLAQFAGIDLKTLEALQSGDLAKRMAEHSATLKRLGVDEDDAARKANALQIALGQLNNTLSGIGTLLLDRFGPSLTQFFEKLNTFIVDNSDKIVQFFEKLGRVAGELYTVFEKLIEVVGPLWQKFDNLTQSIAGVDGLTAALVALIGLKVSGWLLGVAAAITKVGTAASVALLGGALGKFLRLFGIGGAVALAMTPTEANAGEDAEIARRRAAGTWGPAKAGEMEADAARRQSAPKQDNSLWGKVKRWWNGGKDAESAAPIQGTTFNQKAPGVMRRLMQDFGLTKEQAAGIVGNLGHESTGFNELQEKNPLIPGSRGGYGWAQWTGPRRRAFEAWAAEKGLDPASDEANYGFLKHELETSERGALAAVRGAKTVGEATVAFEQSYERAGIKHYGSRHRWAGRALTAYDSAPSQSEAAPATTGAAEVYRRKTGRDLNADLGSSDPHVRKWAAEQAGVSAGGAMPKYTPGSGDVPGMGNAGITSPERAAADDQAVNDHVARMRKQAAAEDLAKAQTILDVTNFEEQLALADRNAGKATGGGLGDPSAALAPPPASTAGTNVTVNQENHVNITGSGDPHDTAQQIGQTQRDVNGGLVRDLKTAVR